MQRDFEIPPPFRGVSDGVGTRSSESRRSYQPARSATKSKAPPRFVPAVFGQHRELQVELNARTQGLLLTMDGLGWSKNPTLALGPHSPLFVPETNLGALQPLKQRLPVAELKLKEEVWWLEPAGVVFLNGRFVESAAPLADGDSLEFEPPVGTPSAWVVAFGEETVPLFWAPLLAGIVHGAITAEPTATEKLNVTLRTGSHSLRLDGAGWLERALSVAEGIAHLELLLEPGSDVDAVRDLARRAPFDVALTDAETFHSTTPARLNRASCPLRGWSTLKAGDLIDDRAVEPRPHSTACPHVQFPADGWRAAPLEREGHDWVLALQGERWRWVELSDGLHERLIDGTIARHPTSFFRPMLPTRERWSRRHFGFRLLPGASAFLEGRRRLPEGELTPDLLGVFADQLTADGDCAGPLLNDVILSTATSQRSLDALLEPWSRLGGTAIPARRALSGVHVCGFYETLQLEPWRDFEKDLPILFTHPMLQRLRHVVLDGRGADDKWCGAARIELIVEAARPFLDGPIRVDLAGQPLRAWL